MVILIPDVDIICCKLWLGFEEGTYAGEFLWEFWLLENFNLYRLCLAGVLSPCPTQGLRSGRPSECHDFFHYPDCHSKAAMVHTDESWQYEAVGLALILQRLRGTIPSISARGGFPYCRSSPLTAHVWAFLSAARLRPASDDRSWRKRGELTAGSGLDPYDRNAAAITLSVSDR